MTHVILQHCCNDASCVAVCPMNCIHPTPDEPGYGTAEMLYIDAESCIDCGVCVDACPIDAILPDDELLPEQEVFVDINALWYSLAENRDYEQTPPRSKTVTRQEAPKEVLRVAVVGAGPTGLYAVSELMTSCRVPLEIEVFERLDRPGGLVRYGVAPDHVNTRGMLDSLEGVLRRKNVRFHAGVEVGRDIALDELRGQFHAVLFTVGAMHTRPLGLPGESLPGSLSAGQFVAWYNGHPDAADLNVDFSGHHAVVVGNGNVALDVARILLSDPGKLAETEIAPRALMALSHSAIERVTVLGRRGPREAAFTTPELIGLSASIPVSVDCPHELLEPLHSDSPLMAHRIEMLRDLASSPPKSGGRSVELVFANSPTRIHGVDGVTGLSLVANDLKIDGHGKISAVPSTRASEVACSLVINAAGFAGREVPGLPWDPIRNVIPTVEGRVTDADGTVVQGSFAAGWIRRGPSGGIGTNRKDAADVVRVLLDDFHEGTLRFG